MGQVPQGCRWVGRAVGVDLHRDFCELAICEDGVVRSAGRVKSTPEALEVLGASLEPTDRVAMEVSGGSWEVARILEPHVQKVIVVSPDDTGIARARARNHPDRDRRRPSRPHWSRSKAFGEPSATDPPPEIAPDSAKTVARHP